MGEERPSDFYTEDVARKAFRLLHHHARNGYERGDCHCDGCDVIVTDLVEFFGFSKTKDSDPITGIYNPAELVRRAANERGWS